MILYTFLEISTVDRSKLQTVGHTWPFFVRPAELEEIISIGSHFNMQLNTVVFQGHVFVDFQLTFKHIFFVPVKKFTHPVFGL